MDSIQRIRTRCPAVRSEKQTLATLGQECFQKCLTLDNVHKTEVH